MRGDRRRPRRSSSSQPSIAATSRGDLPFSTASPFGLDYHRKLRSRARIGSVLDHVQGVGPARRAQLLKAFGSVEALRGVTPEEIAERSHVPLPLARRVAEALGHEEGAA